ncbi:ATP-binding protein [Streptomyces sp. M10(2022)]
MPEFGHQTPQQSRTVQLVSGDLLLTVNPVDGSEIEACPPGAQPATPVRHTAVERASRERVTAPPVPPGLPGPQLPLLERQEERERLVRLLARGRSVRLTGPSGSGRTALLDAVAGDCADLAPDGVVRLSGYKRTTTDLLYGLFEAVYHAPMHRPDREGLLALVHGIGAVVVVDDLEFGGAALDDLLDATPECAFLLGTTPDVAAPTAESHLEEVFLAGLGRNASMELLEKVVERPLTDEEANWSGDLWFESEGLPLRFVQAGALLRQRDDLRIAPEAYGGFGYAEGSPPKCPSPIRLPPTGNPGRTAARPRPGRRTRRTARLPAHRGRARHPALRGRARRRGAPPGPSAGPGGDTHADAALGELAGCGLLSPAGSRYRLAAGVLTQLEASGYGEDAATRARTAAQHYAWWAGHPSVTPERVVAEADAVLASMAGLVPGGEAGQASAAVLLARSAAPAFAAGLHWGAWEGLCEPARRPRGSPARSPKRPTSTMSWASWPSAPVIRTGPGRSWRHPSACAGRSPTSRERWPDAGRSPWSRTAPADRSPAGAQRATRCLLPHATRSRCRRPAAYRPRCRSSPGTPPGGRHGDLPGAGPGPAKGAPGGRPAFLLGARRNLVAVGAGALLVAVLGTVVTLGVTSDTEEPDGQNVTTEQSAAGDESESGLPADGPSGDPDPDGPSDGTATTRPLRPGHHSGDAVPGPVGHRYRPDDGRPDEQQPQ